MRSSLLVVLLALLVLTVSAVPVPYKWCGSSKDDATVESIISNEFPPVKGTTLTLNVTGNLSKQVTSGTYKIVITVGGFPLPDQTGDISMFRPLPWPVGDLNITYQQEIPSVAPPGAYTVKISAVDQDGTQIFCLTIAFTLSERSGGERGELEAAQRVAELPTSPFNTLRTSELIRHTRPTNNIQRLKPVTKMPAMRPLRRL